MIAFILYTILFFIAATLQTVVVPRIEILGAQPSFLLILTVITALRHGPLAGCVLGFMSGLMGDVYAPVEWLGAYSLAYCVIGFTVGQIEASFINLKLFSKILVLIIVYFLKDVIFYISIGKTGDEILRAIASITFPNALYTIAIGAVCFYLLSLVAEKKIDMVRS